jgi:hypothetical protein
MRGTKGLGVRCALAWLMLSTAAPAAAQWVSLGAMSAPRQERNRLTFRNRQGTVVVTVIEPDIFRVRFAPRQELGRDHSYSVVPRVQSDPDAVTIRFGLQSRIPAGTRSTKTIRRTESPFQAPPFASGSDFETTSRYMASDRKPGI